MCDPACDGPSAWRETWRRARKEHRCCACREVVRRGDLYHYLSGIWDGRPAEYRHCARCWAMFAALVAKRPGVMIRLTLDCGETYDGDDPEMLALAFVTRDEAQVLASDMAGVQ